MLPASMKNGIASMAKLSQELKYFWAKIIKGDPVSINHRMLGKPNAIKIGTLAKSKTKNKMI
jgi:hypothetical protein